MHPEPILDLVLQLLLAAMLIAGLVALLLAVRRSRQLRERAERASREQEPFDYALDEATGYRIPRRPPVYGRETAPPSRQPMSTLLQTIDQQRRRGGRG